MPVKIPKYLDVLKNSEAAQDEMHSLNAQEMSKQLELEVTKVDKRIFTEQGKILRAVSEYPINFDAVLNGIDEVELLERRRRQLVELGKQLF